VRIATPHRLPAKRLILATGRSRHLSCQLGISFRRLSPHLAISSGQCDCLLPAGSPAFFQASEGSWRWLAPLGGGKASWARLAPAGSLKGRTRLVTWMQARPAAGDSWTAAGDAALTLDPSWGRGILFALESGVAAGELAARCIRHPQLAAPLGARYDDWLVRTAEAQASALRGLSRSR
jgi:flavin-dependent dehydrogenase